MKLSNFREKQRDAEELKDKINNNMKNSIGFMIEPEKGFIHC